MTITFPFEYTTTDKSEYISLMKEIVRMVDAGEIQMTQANTWGGSWRTILRHGTFESQDLTIDEVIEKFNECQESYNYDTYEIIVDDPERAWVRFKAESDSTRRYAQNIQDSYKKYPNRD